MPHGPIDAPLTVSLPETRLTQAWARMWTRVIGDGGSHILKTQQLTTAITIAAGKKR